MTGPEPGWSDPPVVAGLLMLSFFGIDTPWWYVALCLMIMAAGVGLAVPSLSSGIHQRGDPRCATASTSTCS